MSELARPLPVKSPSNAPINLSADSVSPDVRADLNSVIYLLHSTILRQCSAVFDAGLSKRWWSVRDEAEKNDIRYRYVLAQDEDGEWNLVPEHTLEEVNSVPRVPPEGVVTTFEYLFRAFYHQLDLDTENLTLDACEELVKLADMYCAVSSIKPIIESFAFSHPNEIASNAEAYLNLACMVKSATLYREAAIHLAGKLVIETEDITNLHSNAVHIQVYEASNTIWRQLYKTSVELIKVQQDLLSMDFSKLGCPLLDQKTRDLLDSERHRVVRCIGALSSVPSAGMYRDLAAQAVNSRAMVEGIPKYDRPKELSKLLETTIPRILEPVLKTNILLGNVSEFEHFTCVQITEPLSWQRDDDDGRFCSRKKCKGGSCRSDAEG